MTVKPVNEPPHETIQAERGYMLDLLRTMRSIRQLVVQSPNHNRPFEFPNNGPTQSSLKELLHRFDIQERDLLRHCSILGDYARSLPDPNDLSVPFGVVPRNQHDPPYDKGVLICGAPSSCNRLIKRMVMGCGNVYTQIIHGIDKGAGTPQLASGVKGCQARGMTDIRVLVPIREPYSWRMSQEYGRKNVHGLGKLPSDFDYLTRAWKQTVRAIAITDVPAFFFGIEALMQHPKTVAREIFTWLEVDVEKGLANMEDMRDPNAKYYESTSWKHADKDTVEASRKQDIEDTNRMNRMKGHAS